MSAYTLGGIQFRGIGIYNKFSDLQVLRFIQQYYIEFNGFSIPQIAAY